MSRWAIYSDYSGVADVGEGNGAFPTKAAALDELINKLEAQQWVISGKLQRAKNRKRKLKS